MNLGKLREELSSESFQEFYQGLQEKHDMLSPFATVFDLIDFFHSRNRDYAARDAILNSLAKEYQEAGAGLRLGAFFLVLFTPAIVKISSRARKKALTLDPGEVLSQTCLYLLETIQAMPATQTKVAAWIIGQVKNQVRAWVNQRLKESATEGEFLEEETYDPVPIIEEGDSPVDMEEANGFLEVFVNEGVITETDKLVILGAGITGRSLKETAADPRTYQKIKKRRQRAIAAMKLYLQRKRRLRAMKEGVNEEEISLAEIVRDLMQ